MGCGQYTLVKYVCEYERGSDNSEMAKSYSNGLKMSAISITRMDHLIANEIDEAN